MSLRQNILPDPFEFARRGARLDGDVEARSLERLSELLLASEARQVLHFRVSGRREGDKSYLDVEVEGEVSLQCQRCLGGMAYPIDIAASLLLVPQGETLPDDALEDDSCDPVHAGRDFDVLAAVEDELLLTLPISPMHPQQCGTRQEESAGKPNPFAALAALKRKPE